MFGLHKRPRRSDPRFNRGQSSHTSSISGDHRAVLPGAGFLVSFFYLDGRKQEALVGGEGLTTAPLCRPGRGGPSLLPVKDCPSNSRKPAQADLWDHPPPPPFLLPKDRRGPPLVLSVSFFVPCDLEQPCGPAAAERNAQNTQDRRLRK